MNVASVWRAIFGRWLIVAGVTVAVAALAGIVTMQRSPMYSATAEGLVSISHPQTRPPWALGGGAQYIADRMTTYAQLGTTTPVLLAVYARLNLRDPQNVLVTSQSVPEKALLHVDVTYGDPASAAHIADGIIQEVAANVGRIENGNIVITEVTPATTPSVPSNHNVVVNTGVAAIVGLVLGAFGAIGLQLLSDRRAGRRSANLVEQGAPT